MAKYPICNKDFVKNPVFCDVQKRFSFPFFSFPSFLLGYLPCTNLLYVPPASNLSPVLYDKKQGCGKSIMQDGGGIYDLEMRRRKKKRSINPPPSPPFYWIVQHSTELYHNKCTSTVQVSRISLPAATSTVQYHPITPIIPQKFNP